MICQSLIKQGDLFYSISLTICSIFFLITIGVVYLLKKKTDGFSTQIFRILFILTFLLNLSEICMCSFSHYLGLNSSIPGIFAKIFLFLLCIIFALVMQYILIAVGDSNAKWLSETKSKKVLYTLCFVFVGFLIFLLLFFFDSNVIVKNGIYIINESALNILYAIIPIVVILFIYLFIKGNRKEFVNFIVKYGTIIILLFSLSLFLQSALNFNINDVTFVTSMITVIIYFCYECQDFKMIKELEISKEEAEKANKAQTDFLSNISHEIRTPMNSILGFSETLLRKKSLNKKDIEKDLIGINSAGETLLELINNILDISRIESGKEHVDMKSYSVPDLVFEVTSDITPRINKENVDYKVNINQNLPREFFGDTTKVNKIVEYTLRNAVNTTKYGSITVSYDFESTPNGCIFKIDIDATGSKMTRELFDIEFNDFIRLGESSSNTIDSIVLGLIIAKRYAAMLGGIIEFSTKDDNSKYIIKLEQQIKDSTPIGNIFDIKDDLNSFQDLTGKKVLIVDDNTVNIKLSSKLLSKYNFIVESTTSGKECIKMVKDNKYDVIFLDHMMPEMDGIETFKILKRDHSDLCPVIALTANTDTGIKEEYIKDGFTDYLSKPINVRELNRIINMIFKKENK